MRVRLLFGRKPYRLILFQTLSALVLCRSERNERAWLFLQWAKSSGLSWSSRHYRRLTWIDIIWTFWLSRFYVESLTQSIVTSRWWCACWLQLFLWIALWLEMHISYLLKVLQLAVGRTWRQEECFVSLLQQSTSEAMDILFVSGVSIDE